MFTPETRALSHAIGRTTGHPGRMRCRSSSSSESCHYHQAAQVTPSQGRIWKKKRSLWFGPVLPNPGPSLSSPVVKKLRLYTNRYKNICRTERPETDRSVKLSSPLRLIKPNLDRCSYAVDARFCVFECKSEEKSFSGSNPSLCRENTLCCWGILPAVHLIKSVDLLDPYLIDCQHISKACVVPRFTHLQFSNLEPLFASLRFDTHHDHFKVVLVAHSDHVLRRVLVSDLDLETTTQSELVADSIHQIGKFHRGSDHDVANIVSVHFDPDLAGFGSTSRVHHLKVALVNRPSVVVAAIVVLLINISLLITASVRPARSCTIHVVQIVGVGVIIVDRGPSCPLSLGIGATRGVGRRSRRLWASVLRGLVPVLRRVRLLVPVLIPCSFDVEFRRHGLRAIAHRSTSRRKLSAGLVVLRRRCGREDIVRPLRRRRPVTLPRSTGEIRLDEISSGERDVVGRSVVLHIRFASLFLNLGSARKSKRLRHIKKLMLQA
ncbi:hypothetical protein FJTKL_00066 [Diaporthe vaccinii]|uniref:Uncharacterized protein n=1 Tax=Diaporthe vaccinii TaxID=105482 RepID=A0ABR4E4K8_9PEZI